MDKLPAFLADRIERHLEPGVAFSTNPHDPLWWVRVWFKTGLKPTVETIRAGDSSQARDFVVARYPFADPNRVEVLGVVGRVKPPIPLERRPPPAPKPARAPVVNPPAARRAEPPPQPAPRQEATIPDPDPDPDPDPVPVPVPVPATPPGPAPALAPTAAARMLLEPLPRDAFGRSVFQPDTGRRIHEAKTAGWTWAQICNALGCSHAQAERHLKAYRIASGLLGAAPQRAALQIPPDAPTVQALMADGRGGFRTVTVTLVVQSPDAF